MTNQMSLKSLVSKIKKYEKKHNRDYKSFSEFTEYLKSKPICYVTIKPGLELSLISGNLIKTVQELNSKELE